jgi:hypothetical protein
MAYADAAASGPSPDASLIQAIKADPSAASVILLTAPISSMMLSSRISPQALEAASQALETRVGSLAPWELTSAAFGLAALGSPLSPALRLALVASVTSSDGSSPALPLAHVAVRAWALAVDGAMTPKLWEETCVAIYRKYGVKEFDGISSLFLMHAAMLVAAGACGVPRRGRKGLWMDRSTSLAAC